MASYNNSTLKRMTYNGQKVKKWYHNGVKVFSAGNIVTYQVDGSTAYREEVEYENSCLSPTTFTPTKAGWEFVGWREDRVANGTVLTNKLMGDDPITLYAVFRQSVTITYYQFYDPTAHKKSGYRYYNTGNTVNPKFTITPSGYDSKVWTFRGWTVSTDPAAVIGGAETSYPSINNTEISTSGTFYMVLHRTVTLSFYDAQGLTTKQGTAYANSYQSTMKGASFTPTARVPSKWTCVGWTGYTEANAAVGFLNGETINRWADGTYYARYDRTLTLTMYVNGSTDTRTFVAHMNGSGATSWPKATIANPSLTGASFLGWGNSSGTVERSSITDYEMTSDRTLYAIFKYADYDASSTLTGYFKTPDTLATINGDCVVPIGYVDPIQYSAVTLTLTADLGVGKWTGANHGFIYINNVLLRYYTSSGTGTDADGNIVEGTEHEELGYPCSQGKTATITVNIPLSTGGAVAINFIAKGQVFNAHCNITAATLVGRRAVG